jgi:hypothetical protein
LDGAALALNRLWVRVRVWVGVGETVIKTSFEGGFSRPGAL